MLARLQRGKRHLRVQIMTRCDQHQINLRIVEYRLVVRRRGRTPKAFGGAACGQAGTANDSTQVEPVLELLQIWKVHALGKPARADQRDLDTAVDRGRRFQLQHRDEQHLRAADTLTEPRAAFGLRRPDGHRPLRPDRSGTAPKSCCRGARGQLPATANIPPYCGFRSSARKPADSRPPPPRTPDRSVRGRRSRRSERRAPWCRCRARAIFSPTSPTMTTRAFFRHA